jgi:hypothetical protein
VPSSVSPHRVLEGCPGQPHTAAGEATNAWPFRRLYSDVSWFHAAGQQSLTHKDYLIQPVALAHFNPTHPTLASFAF